jgi:hypothetical protein
MGFRVGAVAAAAIAGSIIGVAPAGSATTLHRVAHVTARPAAADRAGDCRRAVVPLAGGDTARRPRVARLRNPFGASIFGIATGGGIQDEGRSDMAADLGAYREAGARWLRIDINWSEIQNLGPRRFLWGATDRVVRQARRCGLHVLGTIYYTPSWARPAGTSAHWAPPPALFASFAGAAARHYARLGVGAFEIWNEPNAGYSWLPQPSSAAYAALLRVTYPAIKRADPRATVVTGGLSPSADAGGAIAPITFLRGIYANHGGGSFDAVGAHPYSWPAFPGRRVRWSAWAQLNWTATSLRSLMRRHGDGRKRIWATEWGAPTWGPAGSFVSLHTQAAMLTRAYELWATYTWAGPLFTFSGRDLGNDATSDEDWFGLLSLTYQVKPSFNAYFSVSHALAGVPRVARTRPVR